MLYNVGARPTWHDQYEMNVVFALGPRSERQKRAVRSYDACALGRVNCSDIPKRYWRIVNRTVAKMYVLVECSIHDR